MSRPPLLFFISYRRTDSAGHAGRLADALRNKYGEEAVFNDVGSIKGGHHFPTVIKNAIVSSSVVMVLVGPQWLKKRWLRKSGVFSPTDWVRQELATAAKEGKHILPVLVNGGRMPSKNDLPDDLHFFTEYNAITLRDDGWEQDIKEVFQEAEELLKQEPVKPVIETVQGKKSFWQKWKWAAAVAALILVAFLLFKYLRFDESRKEPLSGGGGLPVKWQSTVVKITFRETNGIPWQSTGFFINENGYILSLQPRDIKISEIEVQAADSSKSSADIISSEKFADADLYLLHINKKTPGYLVPVARNVEKDISIDVRGVNKDTIAWKRYSARVDSTINGKLFYSRKEAWVGLFGSPLIDVSDEKVIGLHFGSGGGSPSDTDRIKTGWGLLFSEESLNPLLKLAGYKN